MDAVVFELGVMAGVAGFDAAGVGGRMDSVADRAGDGIVVLWELAGGMATRGRGAMMGEMAADGGVAFTAGCVAISGLCDGRGFASAMSISTDLSTPLSTATVLGSPANSPSLTPERSS